jgi:hypothetical protein
MRFAALARLDRVDTMRAQHIDVVGDPRVKTRQNLILPSRMPLRTRNG